MRKVLVGAAVVVALVVGLLAAGVGALNSEALRSTLASELSSALGQPVEIGGLGIGILPTISLSASNVKIGGAGPEAAPGIALAGLRVVPELSSVLPGRKLAISYVELDGLAIAVRRSADGKWLLPVPPTSAASSSSSSSSSAASVDLQDLRVKRGQIRVVDDSLKQANGQSTVTTITEIAATMQAVGGSMKVPSFAAKLGQTDVSGAAELDPSGATLSLKWASLANGDLPAVFALAGMRPYPGLQIAGNAPFELLVKMAPGFGKFVVTGKASFATVRLGSLTLDQLVAPFKFEQSVFTLDPLTFTSYQGKQSGSVTVNLAATPATYHIRTDLEGLAIDAALSANTTLKHYMEGTGKLRVDVTASGSDAAAIQRSVKGTVGFDIAKGLVHDFKMLATLDEALGITGGNGKDTQFDEFSGTATLGGGVAKTNDMLLKAGALTVTGAGTIGFDQTLDLNMVATLSAAKATELASKAGPAGALRNAKGEIAIPFTVTGTFTDSKTRPDLAGMARAKVKDEVQKGVQKGVGGLMKLLGKPKSN